MLVPIIVAAIIVILIFGLKFRRSVKRNSYAHYSDIPPVHPHWPIINERTPESNEASYFPDLDGNGIPDPMHLSHQHNSNHSFHDLKDFDNSSGNVSSAGMNENNNVDTTFPDSSSSSYSDSSFADSNSSSSSSD